MPHGEARNLIFADSFCISLYKTGIEFCLSELENLCHQEVLLYLFFTKSLSQVPMQDIYCARLQHIPQCPCFIGFLMLAQKLSIFANPQTENRKMKDLHVSIEKWDAILISPEITKVQFYSLVWHKCCNTRWKYSLLFMRNSIWILPLLQSTSVPLALQTSKH